MNIRKAANTIYENLRGTPNDIMTYIDMLIEDGELDEEFFKSNELSILREVDSLLFQCEVCGWNYERYEESENDVGTCVDCYRGEDDE